MRWYLHFHDSSKTMGPLDREEVLSQIRVGAVTAETNVVREGGSSWCRADDDPDLAAMLATQSPPLEASTLPAETAGDGDSDPSGQRVSEFGHVGIVRRESISMSHAIQFGIDRLRSNPWFYLTASLVLTSASLIPGIGYLLITTPLVVGFYRAVHLEHHTGRKARVLDLLGGFRQIGTGLVIALWATAATIVGLLFCCIPGLILIPIPFFACIAAARDQRGGLHALTRALRVLEKDPIGFIATSIMLTVVGLSGLLLFYVGVIFTFPVMLVGFYSIADQMLQPEDA